MSIIKATKVCFCCFTDVYLFKTIYLCNRKRQNDSKRY